MEKQKFVTILDVQFEEKEWLDFLSGKQSLVADTPESGVFFKVLESWGIAQFKEENEIVLKQGAVISLLSILGDLYFYHTDRKPDGRVDHECIQENEVAHSALTFMGLLTEEGFINEDFTQAVDALKV